MALNTNLFANPAIFQAYSQDPRLGYAQALMQQGASTAPVRSPVEGLARALGGALGGYQAGQVRNTYHSQDEAYRQAMINALKQGNESGDIVGALSASPDPTLQAEGLQQELELGQARAKAKITLQNDLYAKGLLQNADGSVSKVPMYGQALGDIQNEQNVAQIPGKVAEQQAMIPGAVDQATQIAIANAKVDLQKAISMGPIAAANEVAKIKATMPLAVQQAVLTAQATGPVNAQNAALTARATSPIQTQTAANTAAAVAPIQTAQAAAQAQALSPIQTQTAANTAAATAPVEVQKAVSQAQALLPIETQKALGIAQGQANIDITKAAALAPVQTAQAVAQAQALLPIETQKALGIAKGMLPIEVQKAAETAKATLPTEVAKAQASAQATAQAQANSPVQINANKEKLSDDYRQDQNIKNYQTVLPVMESMKKAANDNSRAAALNMVYAFAKIMDPGSVVREGEQVLVQGTGAVQDAVTNLLSKIEGGQPLTMQTRQELLAQAQSRVDQLKGIYDNAQTFYANKATSLGFKPQDVFYDLPAPSAAGGPGGAARQYGSGVVKQLDSNGNPVNP